MRTTFTNTLTQLARIDEKIMCIIGDTGYSVFESFESEFGSRFVNVGIAEQNFVGFGAGLAAMGMKPYIYNVVSFMTLRATEQIILDICYQENPVVLVGVGGGFAYATAGPTHHSLQDIAIMSAMPNMTVVCPGDPIEMKETMLASYSYNKPIYIRIGRSVDPIVHKKPIQFEIGRAIKVKDGEDIAIFTMGTILKEVVALSIFLQNYNIKASVISMPTIKPIDQEAIIQYAKHRVPIVTVEEHSIIGGLGDAVGRVLLDNEIFDVKFKKFGVNDVFAPVTGSREYLLKYFHLDSNSICKEILSLLGV